MEESESNAARRFSAKPHVPLSGLDQDLVNSGKTHFENIKKATAQLADDPDNEELKKQLDSHKLYFKAVVDAAGEGNKSKTQDAIFDGLSDEEEKKWFELIYGT